MMTIEVFAGAMFSGKTEELIRRVKRLALGDKKFLAIKPLQDKRTTSEIVSMTKDEDGIFKPHLRLPATPVNSERGLRRLLDETRADVLAIDEAQFFGRWLYDFILKLRQAKKDITILISGLDMDSWGEPFGIMPQLMAIANEVHKEKAVCFNCHQTPENASMTYRKSSSRKRIQIGHADAYEARCPDCWSAPPRKHK